MLLHFKGNRALWGFREHAQIDRLLLNTRYICSSVRQLVPGDGGRTGPLTDIRAGWSEGWETCGTAPRETASPAPWAGNCAVLALRSHPWVSKCHSVPRGSTGSTSVSFSLCQCNAQHSPVVNRRFWSHPLHRSIVYCFYPQRTTLGMPWRTQRADCHLLDVQQLSFPPHLNAAGGAQAALDSSVPTETLLDGMTEPKNRLWASRGLAAQHEQSQHGDRPRGVTEIRPDSSPSTPHQHFHSHLPLTRHLPARMLRRAPRCRCFVTPQLGAGGVTVPAHRRSLLWTAAVFCVYSLIFTMRGRDTKTEQCFMSGCVTDDVPVLYCSLRTPTLLYGGTTFPLLFSKNRRGRNKNLSMSPKNCRRWKLNPSITLTKHSAVWAGTLESYTCTSKEKKMEYYRSVRGNPAPYSKVLHAINQTHMTWTNKKGTTLNQAEQHHYLSRLQRLSSPLRWRIASPLVKFLSDAAARAQVSRTLQHSSWAAHAAGSTGCGGETRSQLASLCPVSLPAAALPLPGLLLLRFAAMS